MQWALGIGLWSEGSHWEASTGAGYPEEASWSRSGEWDVTSKGQRLTSMGIVNNNFAKLTFLVVLVNN